MRPTTHRREGVRPDRTDRPETAVLKEADEHLIALWRTRTMALCEEKIRYTTQHADPFCYSCPANYEAVSTRVKKWAPEKINSATHIESLWSDQREQARLELGIDTSFAVLKASKLVAPVTQVVPSKPFVAKLN